MIIKAKQPDIIIPKRFIKEEIDRVHRQDWEDPDRYARQKKKALRYIPVRALAIEHFVWERLVHEVARVFHDDLAADPDIKEAAQRACWIAEQQHYRQDQQISPEPAVETAARGPVRGVDDTEETAVLLEWQFKEETS